MTCDDVMAYALASGPRPSEVEDHLRRCGRCASELEALRAMAATLAAAAPALTGTAALERAVTSRLGLPHQRGRAWLSAAAALLLAFALATAWLGRSISSSAVPQRSPADALALHLNDEDSTAGLLQAYEPIAADLPQVQPEDYGGYLSPADQGGWNG